MSQLLYEVLSRLQKTTFKSHCSENLRNVLKNFDSALWDLSFMFFFLKPFSVTLVNYVWTPLVAVCNITVLLKSPSLSPLSCKTPRAVKRMLWTLTQRQQTVIMTTLLTILPCLPMIHIHIMSLHLIVKPHPNKCNVNQSTVRPCGCFADLLPNESVLLRSALSLVNGPWWIVNGE